MRLLLTDARDEDEDGVRRDGLLLGWERTPDGWRGRVALVPDLDAVLVVALVSAVYLENAGPDGPLRHLR